jgi:hypothetical protein
MTLLRGVAAALAWRLALLIGAACALYAAWTVEPTASAPRRPVPVAVAPAAADPAAAPAHGGLGAYTDIAAHPLFFPARAPWVPPPPPAPVVVSKAPPPLTNYALVGVVVSGDTRTALIRPPGGRKTIMLAEGQDLAGWTLQEITSAGLRFAAGTASYDMNFPKPSQVAR